MSHTTHSWIQRGFKDFSQGTYGNGGQNLYVSAKGIIQRIHRFDVNGDGHVDLLFLNSHDMNERPPAYVIQHPQDPASTPLQLPTLGAYAGAVGDLNGDGYDELVLAHQCNGTHTDITAYVYFGGPEGFSEKYKIELPVPDGRGTAIGDFNGDGKVDLAFISEGKLRVFWQNQDNAFIPNAHTDYPIEITHLEAHDLDGDGITDLYVRVKNGKPRILWGSPHGFDLNCFTEVGGKDESTLCGPSTTPSWTLFAEGWKPKILNLNGKKVLFRSENNQAYFYPVQKNRALSNPIILDCKGATSATCGDLNGDSFDEIVIAVCTAFDGLKHADNYSGSQVTLAPIEVESSWIYWSTNGSYSNNRRSPIQTCHARDVQMGKLTPQSNLSLLVCQGRTHLVNTTESILFCDIQEKIIPSPIRFTTHDAVNAFFAKTNSLLNQQIVIVNHVGGRFRGDVNSYIYLGGPDGYQSHRRIELPGWAPPDGALCDLNDDGLTDVLISNSSENSPWMDPGSFIYWNSPQGFENHRKTVLPTFRAHGSAIGDFRHSGFLDLIFSGFSNAELLIFRGGPKGFDTQNPEKIVLDPSLPEVFNQRGPDWKSKLSKDSNYSEPRWLFTADFNNDGWLDLFVSQCCGTKSLILWGGPEGFSMKRCTWLATEGAICAQAADLTGNGFLDLVIGGHWCQSKKNPYDSYLYIYWNGPDGFREDRRTQLAGHCINSISIADFNRDGIMDIFATSYKGGRDRDLDSYIYWGTSKGHYSVENRTRLFGHSACGCVAADFNEDGYVDLAVAHHKTYGVHEGYSKIWWNGPNGFNPQHTSKLPTVGPHGMQSVDPGNIMDRSPEEYYTSTAYPLPSPSKLTGIEWKAELQAKTWIKAQIRWAKTQEKLSKASWFGPQGPESWFDAPQKLQNALPLSGWIQYRLALGATNGCNTPRISEVHLSFENT